MVNWQSIVLLKVNKLYKIYSQVIINSQSKNHEKTKFTHFASDRILILRVGTKQKPQYFNHSYPCDLHEHSMI